MSSEGAHPAFNRETGKYDLSRLFESVDTRRVMQLVAPDGTTYLIRQWGKRTDADYLILCRGRGGGLAFYRTRTYPQTTALVRQVISIGGNLELGRFDKLWPASCSDPPAGVNS